MLEQTLPLYRVFYAVANAGNISSASKQLFISQPAVSKSIHKLEESMNCALFMRKPKGVELTEEGQLLYQKVEEALAILDQAEEDISASIKDGTGSIKISTTVALGRRFLLPYVNVFLKAHPRMNVSINFRAPDKIASDLEKNKADIGLTLEPIVNGATDNYSLGTLHYIFVAKPGYYKGLRVAKKVDVNTILRKATLILVNGADNTRHWIDVELKRQGLKADNIIEVNFLDMVIDFVKMGMGIGFVIKEFVEEELEDGTFIEVPLNLDIYPKEAVFVKLVKAVEPPSVEKFWQMLSQTEI